MKKNTCLIIVALIILIFSQPGGMDAGLSAADRNESSTSGEADGQEDSTTFSIYITKKGDTLQSIAAQRSIYRNPLKWPLLFFMNREELKNLRFPSGATAATPLPPRLVLAYLRPEEAQKKTVLKDSAGKRWVVNVLSALDQEEIYPAAVKLLDSGYFTYITEWRRKGKDWLHLRVGFFADQETAAAESKAIAKLVNRKDCWVVMAEGKELNEYLGFAATFATD